MTPEHITTVVNRAWTDGYQQAVKVLRSFAENFGDDETKPALLAAADMIEAAKPPPR
jgi:hypothetical protein